MRAPGHVTAGMVEKKEDVLKRSGAGGSVASDEGLLDVKGREELRPTPRYPAQANALGGRAVLQGKIMSSIIGP